MPLYIVSNTGKALPDRLKQTLSQMITDAHSRITGAPPTFVHVFFFERELLRTLGMMRAIPTTAPCLIFANIRRGRNDETKRALIAEIREAASEQLAVELDDVHMVTRDVSASWVMEGGELLPEPGEEAFWLAEQQRRLANAGALKT